MSFRLSRSLLTSVSRTLADKKPPNRSNKVYSTSVVGEVSEFQERFRKSTQAAIAQIEKDQALAQMLVMKPTEMEIRLDLHFYAQDRESVYLEMLMNNAGISCDHVP